MNCMKKRLEILLLLLFIAFYSGSHAQPYASDIAAFRKQDSASFPGTGKILFVGSSSFTNWKDVQSYFPSFPVINRGFGGSTLLDVYRYRQDVIYPYQPRQIIMYCGENDIANDSMVSGKTVFRRFKKLYNDVGRTLGPVPFVYISMKPSPSRWHLREKYIEGNRLIRRFLEKKGNARIRFVSVWEAMLGSDGKPKPEIFLSDNLHMNATGYAIWKKLIEPLLIK